MDWFACVLVGLQRSIAKTAFMVSTVCRRRAPPATALQLVVPTGERRGFIQRYHDSIFAGHLGVSQTVCRLLYGSIGLVCVKTFGLIWPAVYL